MADGDNTKTVSAEDFEKLQAKYDRTLGELTDVKKTLDQFKGIDIAKLKADSEALTQLEKEVASTSPDKLKEWKDKEKQKLRDEVAKELKEAKELTEKLSKENRKLKITDKVFAAIAPKFNEDVHDDLKEYAERYGDLDDQGNIIFKDAQGNPRFKNGNEPFTIEDFGAELVQKKPSWAKASFTGGTHQNGATTKGGTDYSHIKTFNDLMKLPNAREVLKNLPYEQQQEIGRNTKL